MCLLASISKRSGELICLVNLGGAVVTHFLCSLRGKPCFMLLNSAFQFYCFVLSSLVPRRFSVDSMLACLVLCYVLGVHSFAVIRPAVTTRGGVDAERACLLLVGFCLVVFPMSASISLLLGFGKGESPWSGLRWRDFTSVRRRIKFLKKK